MNVCIQFMMYIIYVKNTCRPLAAIEGCSATLPSGAESEAAASGAGSASPVIPSPNIFFEVAAAAAPLPPAASADFLSPCFCRHGGVPGITYIYLHVYVYILVCACACLTCTYKFCKCICILFTYMHRYYTHIFIYAILYIPSSAAPKIHPEAPQR